MNCDLTLTLFTLASMVNFFDSVFFSILLSFDTSACTKYILPERSSGEEYIKHHLSTLLARFVCVGGGGGGGKKLIKMHGGF